jgi:SAM-dependent methyltransferase
MNHYLRVKDAPKAWWKSSPASESPLLSELIEKHWDHGPFEVVASWVPEESSVIELGCGVGGLYSRLRERRCPYLGVDSSFFSVFLARHLQLGTGGPETLQHPTDLLLGGLSEELVFPKRKSSESDAVDFIVGEMDDLPLKPGKFQVSISLNAIDMLDTPERLPEAQAALVGKGGVVIQSGPYVWHEKVARRLRSTSPKKASGSSAEMVEWLYERTGLQVTGRDLHVPWLFFKHLRQLEIYSVHCFRAEKRA